MYKLAIRMTASTVLVRPRRVGWISGVLDRHAQMLRVAMNIVPVCPRTQSLLLLDARAYAVRPSC